jgi:hypothetical protein
MVYAGLLNLNYVGFKSQQIKRFESRQEIAKKVVNHCYQNSSLFLSIEDASLNSYTKFKKKKERKKVSKTVFPQTKQFLIRPKQSRYN